MDFASDRSFTSAAAARLYRLVDRHGSPHPVLDDLYESLDAAWAEAMAWWGGQAGMAMDQPIEIGVEVSTLSGDWRTLRAPGQGLVC